LCLFLNKTATKKKVKWLSVSGGGGGVNPVCALSLAVLMQ